MIKTNDGWKITQRHTSSPAVGIEEGHSWPTANGLVREIEKSIHNFDLNPFFNEKIKRSELLNYLTKAKEIIQTAE